MMKIHSLSIKQTDETTEKISAFVDDMEVWFEISGSPVKLSHSYDPFLLSGFVLAMKSAEDIEVADDAGTSKHLVSNLNKVMDIYCQWDKNLSKINIQANHNISLKNESNGFVGCFFSGGADSLYSYIVNESEITHLILCQGLDIQFDETQRWQKTLSLISMFAKAKGKEIITIKSNVKKSLETQVGIDPNFAAILVSNALGIGMQKLIVPASIALDNLAPHGSHLLTDHLFSNGITEVIHDSPISRSKKMMAIADSGIGLDILRVCNVNSSFNCGICEKCLRTRLVLTVLGAECEHLEPLKSHELRSLKLSCKTEKSFVYFFWVENLQVAKEYGHTDFEYEIERILRNYRIRTSLRQLDCDLLGGRLTKLIRLLRS